MTPCLRHSEGYTTPLSSIVKATARNSGTAGLARTAAVLRPPSFRLSRTRQCGCTRHAVPRAGRGSSVPPTMWLVTITVAPSCTARHLSCWAVDSISAWPVESCAPPADNMGVTSAAMESTMTRCLPPCPGSAEACRTCATAALHSRWSHMAWPRQQRRPTGSHSCCHVRQQDRAYTQYPAKCSAKAFVAARDHTSYAAQQAAFTFATGKARKVHRLKGPHQA